MAQPPFTTPRRVDVLLSVGTVLSVTFGALSLAAAHWGVFDLDHRTQALVGLSRRAWLHGSMETISLLGQATALTPLILLVSCLAWRHSRRWAVAFPCVMAGAGALQLIAKWAVNRPRPNAEPWGFPSGHALIVVVFFGVVAYLVCTSRAGRYSRCAAAGVCAATVVSVGFSRLYLDMHWLSDVGGGLAVGLAYLLGAIRVVELIPSHARLTRA